MAGPIFAAETVATTDGDLPGLSLQIRQLKVSNGTVMLLFTVINDGSINFRSGYIGRQNHRQT